MKSLDRIYDKIIPTFNVKSAKLGVQGHPDIDLGRSVILRVPKSGEEGESIILNNSVAADVKVSSPTNILKGLCSKYKPLKPVSTFIMGNGEQVGFSFAMLNGKDDKKPVVSPVSKFQIGGLDFHAYIFHVHRYDKLTPTVYLEVEVQNKDRDIFYILFEGQGTFNSLHDLFNIMYHREDNGEFKRWLYMHHTGYDNLRRLIGSRKEDSIKKLESISQTIQKQGINILGENCLGVLIGWVNWFNKILSDNDIKSDTIVYKGSSREKFEVVWDKVIAMYGID